MATSKKTTKKTPAKRFVTGKEYDSFKKKYYALRQPIYKLLESGKLNGEAQKHLNKLFLGLDKAWRDFNGYRATNYQRG